MNRRDIVRQSGVSFATRCGGLAVAFLANIVLARLLGASGYGLYAIAIGWASVLAIPARLGLDNVALRFVTIYRERREPGALGGLLRTSGKVIGLVSATAAAAAILVALAMGEAAIDPWMALGVGLLVFPLAALGWLSAVIRAFGRIFAAQAYEQLYRPALLIGLLAAAWLAGVPIHPALALGLTLLAVAIPLLVLAGQVRREAAALGSAAPDYSDRRLWMTVSWPLFLLSLFQEASNQLEVILLGSMRGSAEAAQFAAASRLSALASFGLVAIAAVSAPAIASAFHRQARREAAQLATLNARISLAFAAVVIAALLVFGELALAAFGPAFTAAYPVLAILLAGAFLNSFTGNVANFMLMTGHERYAAVFMAVGLAVALVLDLLLIPRLGAVGAAIGSVGGLSAWNLLMLVYVRRTLGIDSSPLALHARSIEV